MTWLGIIAAVTAIGVIGAMLWWERSHGNPTEPPMSERMRALGRIVDAARRNR